MTRKRMVEACMKVGWSKGLHFVDENGIMALVGLLAH